MSQSYRIKPSIDNAYARVRRAKQHLTRLKREITIFRRSVSPPNVEIEGGRLTISHHHEPTPVIFRILVGETIYNLRAALDYLVYELAILDSGKIHKRTQFLIEDTEEGWTNYQRRLDGLSSEHKAAIEVLQPWRGCKWTGILKLISNADKHRALFHVDTPGVVSIGDAPSSAAKSSPVKVQADVAIEILFWNRAPVVETLQILHSKVSSVLDSFNPEF